MGIGKKIPDHASPIVKALSYLSRRTTGDVRVHLSKRFFEKDPMGRALALFEEYEMTRTSYRNGILVYVNLATRSFSIISDEGIHRVVGQRYWDELAVNFREDLQSTYFENAIALLLYTLSVTLEKYFPNESAV